MAPNVSFVNCLRRSWNGKKSKAPKPNVTRLMRVRKAVLAAIEPLVYCYLVEPGACNLFLATSARYPASVSQDGVAGVPADSIATGIDEKVAGGAYTIHVGEEDMGVKVTRLQAWKKKKAS